MFTLKGAGLAAVWYEIVPLKLNSFPFFVNMSKKKASLISDDSKSSLDDDMAAILDLYSKADVLVLATPVYFYGISAQLKTFIDRMYPIWQHLGKKEVYYIVAAGLGTDVIERSLGDITGFVEHLEEYKIAGKLYAPNMTAPGAVKDLEVFQEAYAMGYAL